MLVVLCHQRRDIGSWEIDYAFDLLQIFWDTLVLPIENILFDVFDKRYSANWLSVMAKFHESVELIEEDTKAFIDYSFDQLRSAEGAFDLLQNFKNIKSR
eukprot:COSAG03_NODE_68_length_15004_cov_6.604764_1_plen_99_part_10